MEIGLTIPSVELKRMYHTMSFDGCDVVLNLRDDKIRIIMKDKKKMYLKELGIISPVTGIVTLHNVNIDFLNTLGDNLVITKVEDNKVYYLDKKGKVDFINGSYQNPLHLFFPLTIFVKQYLYYITNYNYLWKQ